MTNICCNKHTFVMTNNVFCHDKHVFVITKISLVATKLCLLLLQQKFSHDKNMFVMIFFLSQQAYFCHDKHVFCHKKNICGRSHQSCWSDQNEKISPSWSDQNEIMILTLLVLPEWDDLTLLVWPEWDNDPHHPGLSRMRQWLSPSWSILAPAELWVVLADFHHASERHCHGNRTDVSVASPPSLLSPTHTVFLEKQKMFK